MGDPFKNLDFGVPNLEFNSQHNQNAGHFAFDLASLDLCLQSREQAQDSDIESQNVESTLQEGEKARDSKFDTEILDQFLPNQEYGEGFELSSQNFNSNYQVLEDRGGFQPSRLGLSEVELPLENDENEPYFNDRFDLNNQPASLDNHPPSPYVKDY